jgi:hypothetical protein
MIAKTYSKVTERYVSDVTSAVDGMKRKAREQRMSREILFKVWDKDEGRMLYSDEPSDQFVWFIEPNGIRIHELDGCGGGKDLKNFVVMQYIGRDDIHGKKMFEGDRVRFVIRESHYWSQGEIKYDNCSFYIDCFGFACYTWLDYYDFEIIGNVHDTESEVGR